MEREKNPYITQPVPWKSRLANLRLHSNLPLPLAKQETVDSDEVQFPTRPDPFVPTSNELVPYQEGGCTDASSLEYAPCTEVYNSGRDDYEEQDIHSFSDPTNNQQVSLDASSRTRNSSKRVLPAVGEFTVQCAKCLKWRLIPTKEQYEAIRQCILEYPWVCEDAHPWCPNASCNDPGDIEPDNSRLWAIDKPNISQPPTGWERLLVLRGEGASKFADVYYVTPSGKKLRSMVEVDRFLNENPQYIMAGVTLSQFSFQIPKPLFDGYVRKRSSSNTSDANRMKRMRAMSELERNLNATQAKPLAWRKPEASSSLGMSSSMFGNGNFDGSSYNQAIESDLWRTFFPQISKKKRSSRMRSKTVVTNWNLYP
ncbi:methyl-CpG-binding domain-containing protein 2 isoform X2 [Cryptomeria japonica]|uniref:methyl-CpG-binding domain-containing protein 2 isoform X1 n=1 Tax=Cryptomeria japonica TaxID=3369 RepID=UPI0027DAA5BB|nr:methyl-CpG-binding domain-containing protein 2 isoform X1 [Cryptomeria japonica]XP_057836011.2 methyl-CpG-binding domain-containing protein 2 isoform X2 [Cryptomeria japonica]